MLWLAWPRLARVGRRVAFILAMTGAAILSAAQFWRHDPQSDSAPHLTRAAANGLTLRPVTRHMFLCWLRLPGKENCTEQGDLANVLREDGLASPDGRWIAAVTQHI